VQREIEGHCRQAKHEQKMRHGKKRANDEYIKLYGKIGMGNL
jgi:hypothetical protein